MRICANLVVKSSRMVKRVTGSDVTGTVGVGSTTGVLVLQENPGEAQSLWLTNGTMLILCNHISLLYFTYDYVQMIALSY